MMVMIALFYCAGLTIQFRDSIVVIFVVVVLIISFHDRDESSFFMISKNSIHPTCQQRANWDLQVQCLQRFVHLVGSVIFVTTS